MTVEFFKYQGTGNDFIIIDNRLDIIDKNDTKRIKELCDRRFGIGADGFILLENDEFSDFKMVYFNSDGNLSSMCGNGGRCITAFAKFLNIIDNTTCFSAVDGLHDATIEDSVVSLKMQNVKTVKAFDSHLFLDTGSPHHIQMVEGLKDIDVKSEGSKIRYAKPYGEIGSNVNFVETLSKDSFAVRTYERGVEDETLSCGTGVTAVALAMHAAKKTQETTVTLKTEGGELDVRYKPTQAAYDEIWLIGPAIQVFKGSFQW